MKLEIHVHVHNSNSSPEINQIKEIVMSLKDAFETLRLEMKEATDKLAAKLDLLVAQSQRTDMTEAEEQSVKDGFQEISNQLKAMGTDPANPVPEVDSNS
jgi:chromosome segregation ATPase